MAPHPPSVTRGKRPNTVEPKRDERHAWHSLLGGTPFTRTPYFLNPRQWAPG